MRLAVMGPWNLVQNSASLSLCGTCANMSAAERPGELTHHQAVCRTRRWKAMSMDTTCSA
jgi:hypothetical protein